MAGPIFAVSVTLRSDTEKRWDLLSAWRNERMENRLQVSIAQQTDAQGGDNKYPMITLTDWLAGVAKGEGFFVDVRVDKPALMAWLQAAPAPRSAHADSPF